MDNIYVVIIISLYLYINK